MKRYYCPWCGIGKLVPVGAKPLDVRLYCLACSERRGSLVKRYKARNHEEAARIHEATIKATAERKRKLALGKAKAVAADIQEALSPKGFVYVAVPRFFTIP